MRQIDIIRTMFNAAPASIRQQVPSFKTRWESVDIERDHPAYDWVQDNRAAAHLLRTAYEKLRIERRDIQYNKDLLQKDLRGRNAQANVIAVERALCTVDVPYKSNAKLFEIRVDVPGYSNLVSRGRTYSSHHWCIEVPVSYHKNTKRVRQNMIHSVTQNGSKWLNFITRYDQVSCTEPGTDMFACLVSAFEQDTGCQENRTGFYAEHQFDDEVCSAFAYTEKRALSLLNKRVKAAILEKLGVA